jgi:hypothetical protein
MRNFMRKCVFLGLLLLTSMGLAGTSHIPFSVNFGHEAWLDFTALNPQRHELVCYLASDSHSAHMFVFEKIFVDVNKTDLQPGESKRYVYESTMDQIHIMFSSEAAAKGACDLTEMP